MVVILFSLAPCLHIFWKNKRNWVHCFFIFFGLSVESNAGSERTNSAASVPYSDLMSPTVTVPTRKISEDGSTDSIDAVNPPIQTGSSPVKAAVSTSNASTTDAQLLAILVAELACCVCGKLTRQPQLEPDGKTMNANILIECVQCGALYHPMCHQPPVLTSSGVNQQGWLCGSCAPSAQKSGEEPVLVGERIATTIPATTEVPLPNQSPACTVVSSNSPSVITPAPTVGARKRKSGLQSALSGPAFRRLWCLPCFYFFDHWFTVYT